MTYTVQTLSPNASNFQLEFHKQLKYISNDLSAQPLPSDIISMFNSVTLPRAYEKINNDIWNFHVYEDDTWVISYPKCGTTWTQEAVWQVCNGVDIEGRGKESIRERFPFLEIQAVGASVENEVNFEFLNKLKRPRFIKSHLPICFLPKQLWTVKPKIVYVAREPKDAAVSFWHHYYNLYKYCGTKEEFLNLFLNGLVEHGSYWNHIQQFHLLQAHYPNLQFILFENLKHNLKDTLNELCTFLNKPIKEEQMQQLIQHLQFENMKANPAINPGHLKVVVQKNRPGSDYMFVRRGATGSHKDEMTQEYIKKFDKITKKRFHTFGLYQTY